MELGNLIFGNSRGEYPFPNRDIVKSEEWKELCKKAQVDISYGQPECNRDFNGFDNEIFTIRPYYWGDNEEIMELPNFIYKPTNFQIQWYKYAFRDSYMNQNLTEDEILNIFKECVKSL